MNPSCTRKFFIGKTTRIPRRLAHLAAASTLAAPLIASADPLNPLDYPSLGTVTLTAGSYTINSTTTPPAITGPMNFTGSIVGFGPGSIAVFSFDQLTIPIGVTFTVTGNRMLAFLSAGDMSIASAISVNGGAGGTGQTGPGTGGMAVAGSGSGDTGGGPGNGTNSRGGAGNGPGGGTGGRGSSDGAGGAAYGNLLLQLAPGSGGGGAGGASSASGGGGGGGGGGGALELGAMGTLSLSATLSANGANGGQGGPNGGGGGGGSGGGILLHASTLSLPPSITSRGGAGAGIGTGTLVGGGGGGGAFGGAGGNGGPGGPLLNGGGGGGSGGLVTLQSVNTPSTTGISLSGGSFGSGGSAGAVGVITSSRVALTTTNLDFGDVAVGSSKTLGLMIQNTGDSDTCVNGRFPATLGAPFSRVGAGVFSGLKPGQFKANPYTFAPTSTGTFNQTLTFLSNAGPVQVTISGRGVDVNHCIADVDDGTASGNPDGGVGIEDLLYFLFRYNAGC